MSLVVFQSLGLTLGGKPIVRELDLRIGEGERIGLVGPNGSGKTSLLRLLAGELDPDAGDLSRRRGLRVAYLPQDMVLETEDGLTDFVSHSVPGRPELQKALEDAEQRFHEAEGRGVQDADQLTELGTELAEAHEAVHAFETRYSPHEARSILAGLGFSASDHGRPLSEFSGGWRMRALLASLLFQQPDLLLLDEPTNHLDLPSVAWFSSFLRRYRKSFVLISHDREFLNEQIERVLSFEVEGVRSYPGDYEQYRRQRAEELTLLENQARNVERKREQLERFVERFRAKASKASQAQSRAKQLEKLERVELPRDRARMHLRFPPVERAGRHVLQATGVGKSFGALSVFKDVDLRVERGQKIAILGSNGAGKTTLLRIVAGELQSDGGEVQLGHNVTPGYYAQHHVDVLRPDATLYEEVARADPEASITRLRSVLGAFLFSGDEVDKKIRVLSGGERARVALARLLIKPGNLLLMDEPTNHLDLESSEILTEALASYDGTLVFVSHNRSFIRGLATGIWSLDQGRLEAYPGTFDEFMEAYRERGDADEAAKKETASRNKPAKRSRKAEKERKRTEALERAQRKQQGSKLKRRCKELEERIQALEAEQRGYQAQWQDPEVATSATRGAELRQSEQKVATELEVLTELWMEAQQALEAEEEKPAT